jgi:hypothetical protein
MTAVFDMVQAAYSHLGGQGDAEPRLIRPRNMTDLTFPIKTVSEANRREHWTVKNKRKIAQQTEFRALWRTQKRKVTLPAIVTFTRYSCKVLDDDNLRGAFKGIRDALAREIKIDDGSDQVKWRYEQVKTSKREHYFTVEITEV